MEELMLKKTQATFFTVLVVLMLGVSACASTGGLSSLSLEDLASTHWQLSELGDIGAELPVVEGSTVTLDLGTNGEISGNAGCKSFAGTFTLDNSKLTVGEITSTLMACTDQLVMDQENQVLTALKNATGIELNGDELTILYNEGKSALRFLAAQAAPTE
jgi:heat shock protein HslJ